MDCFPWMVSITQPLLFILAFLPIILHLELYAVVSYLILMLFFTILPLLYFFPSACKTATFYLAD